MLFSQKKYEIWQESDNSRRRYSLLNCRRVIWISISSVQKYTAGDARILKVTWRNEAWSLPGQRAFLLFQNLIVNKHPPNFLVWLWLLATRSNHCPQTPWCQLQWVQASQWTSKSHSAVVWVRLRFNRFFKASSFPNFKDCRAGTPGFGSSANRSNL